MSELKQLLDDMVYLIDVNTRYRTALERCAEGALVVESQGKSVNVARELVNVAKQALAEQQPQEE